MREGEREKERKIESERDRQVHGNKSEYKFGPCFDPIVEKMLLF